MFYALLTDELLSVDTMASKWILTLCWWVSWLSWFFFNHRVYTTRE